MVEVRDTCAAYNLKKVNVGFSAEVGWHTSGWGNNGLANYGYLILQYTVTGVASSGKETYHSLILSWQDQSSTISLRLTPDNFTHPPSPTAGKRLKDMFKPFFLLNKVGGRVSQAPK